MHNPVLLKEMTEALSPKDGGVYVDATFGGGGYSRRILESAKCVVHAIDRDVAVLEFFEKLLRDFPNSIHMHTRKFSELKEVLSFCGVEEVDGIVFDLGTSAMQLGDPNRGFSFTHNGLLNMKMDNFSTKNAAAFVNTTMEKEIADVIYYYGGERYARRVARAIVNARKKRRIGTTGELAEIVRSVVPRSRANPIDPATRTFQAIRIWVNDELEELQVGLDVASKVLKLGGKIVVTSFHSLEDRIVKRTFNMLCSSGFNLINKKVIRPTEEEITSNPRSRSGRLRAVIRTE